MEMRLQSIILVTGCLLLSAGFAVSGQEEPLAEQEFRNIKSFKGMKASEVLPAMQYMSAAMKVDCEYCHVEDRASDDKEEKRTSRDMIAMTKEINDKNFDGKPEVTCATCHAGNTHPISVPPVAGLDSRPRRSPDVNPADALAAFAKASGVPAGPTPAWRLEGSGVVYGQDVKIEALYSGQRFMMASQGATGKTAGGFNGELAWFAFPDKTVQIPAELAGKYARENMVFIGPESLPKLTEMSGGTAKIGDREMVVVMGPVAGEKCRASLYFDKTTGLLARTVFSYQTVLGNNVVVRDYSDYKEVEGVKIPMTIRDRTGDDKDVRKFTIAKPEKSLDPKAFDPKTKGAGG